MALLGSWLKKGITVREGLEQQYSSPLELQKHVLRHLLIRCEQTAFGKAYGFKELLKSFKKEDGVLFYDRFRKEVPLFDYESIDKQWWHRARAGERDVCWPGKVRYFALSSGTSGTSSKYIPVTKSMVKSIRKTSVRQILTLSKYDLPDEFFTKGILMLGGSTHLKNHGTYFEGDLSGITTSQIPFWFQHYYKPGKRIASTIDWGAKLDEITLNAAKWDIGIIVGVPAWLEILMEKIVHYYQVANIHEVWPNLRIFVHGGVSFEPYKKGFEKLLGKPMYFMETYLASEGFIAFQAFPNRKSMRLVLNNGIFYEFIPFNSKNFTGDGEMVEHPETLIIDQVEEGVEYALLISTNAGAWRYLIGDVIKFASKEESEIVITGRTKHFLSLCGEHLSLDNMNKAIEMVGDELNMDVREFTVIGDTSNRHFAHRWYLGTDDIRDADQVRLILDDKLKLLNDDYAVERQHALKHIHLQILPTSMFYQWMKLHGKEGGQNKFPRVLKGAKSAEWQQFVASTTNSKT